MPRQLANQDVDEAIDYYLSEGAKQAAFGFIEALEQAYTHIVAAIQLPDHPATPMS